LHFLLFISRGSFGVWRNALPIEREDRGACPLSISLVPRAVLAWDRHIWFRLPFGAAPL
jgi:hypothetical protein